MTRLRHAPVTAAPIARKRKAARGRKAARLRLPRDLQARRMLALLVVYVLALGGIVARIVNVQVVAADAYALRSATQRNVTMDLPASRGRLYDRDGAVLAASVDAATIYAVPRAYRPSTTPDGTVKPAAADAGEVAARLAPLLGMDVTVVRERLLRGDQFSYVARQVDYDLGQRIMSMKLPGIEMLVEPRRSYPAGSLAAQVIGFTDIDGRGLEGLELAANSALAGSPGTLVREAAPQGLTIAGGLQLLTPPQPGTDLVLTLDREIQSVAEQAAAEAVEQFDAVGASVVVLEVGTGEVLAMASAPGFDPTDRSGTDLAARRNRALTDNYEPGSVSKSMTIAAALEEGLVTPSTTFEVDDRITIGPKTFSDAHDHPLEDMTVAEILKASSNVGTMMIADRLGPERLHDYLVRFGYGSPTGIDFPGEAGGILMPAKSWWVTSLPTIAIGQGVAVTLLQSANAYATLANDGVSVVPTLVRGRVDVDGRLTPNPAPPTRRVVSRETATALRTMLAGVVDGDGGTGARASVPGYSVAGKTGTARKPLADARGYSDQYVATFVGMAPAENPRLVVAVMVDEPYPIYGGVVAAPVFSDVMGFALRARRVAPDRPTVTLSEALAAAADARASLEGPALDADALSSPIAGMPVAGRARRAGSALVE